LKLRRIVEMMQRLFFPISKDYRERMKLTLKRWLLNHQNNIIFEKCKWMGVSTYKNPLDLWIYQEIIWEIKPDVIVEIGSAQGGSTLHLAQLMDNAKIDSGIVVSIEIDRSDFHVSHERIVELTGDSGSNAIIGKVAELCHGKKVLVIHDGDHHRDKVLDDLKKYARFVSVGSYLIVEDGIIDLFTYGDGIGTTWEGPLKSVERFITDNSNFIIDHERERYILTYNPKGFLKRIG